MTPPQTHTLATLPEITLVPTATLDKRQQIVTLSLTASQSPTATPTKSKSFPVAVAIPALVGGMALAIGGFLLYWWIAKRRRREKRLRWERHQRRKRSRANTATSRPSLSAQPSNLKPVNEKSFVPPVPALPKHAHPYKEQPTYEHQNYHSQPPIEQPYPDIEPEKPKTKPSKSAARVAAAENAANAAHGDINTRYQPKKPSPLALKAQERAAGDVGGPKWGDGPFRVDPQISDRQGEWGVALGSPNHDGDSYTRGKSGVYSNDPYSAYHEDVDYHQVADKMGLDKGKQSWV